MNIKTMLLAGAVCAGLWTAHAAEKVQAGPKGGRILDRTHPQAEFFVEKDRTVSITFYDAAGRPVAPAGQTATVIADGPAGKQKLELEAKGNALASTMPLPPGEANNVVVQLKQSAEGKPQNFRFKADLSTCGGCKRAEYACTCAE